jgi:hypothetical protein
MARDRHGPDDAVRITTAAASREEDIAGRQRRYILSMGIRTVCFVGAILASVAGLNWLWPILIVAALILPYVAVVMANAANTRRDGFALIGQVGDQPELEAGKTTKSVAPGGSPEG